MFKTKKHSILVVDDDENILDIYSQALAMMDFKVKTAHNGKEAWEIIKEKKNKFDLILLDIIMPKMDGFDVLEKMYKNRIDAKVVMLTNLNRPEDMKEAKRLGAEDFLVKVKTSPSQLTKKVDQILKHA